MEIVSTGEGGATAGGPYKMPLTLALSQRNRVEDIGYVYAVNNFASIDTSLTSSNRSASSTASSIFAPPNGFAA